MTAEDVLLWMGLGVSATLGFMLIAVMLRDALCLSSRLERGVSPLLSSAADEVFF
jgi:hypothetical protein